MYINSNSTIKPQFLEEEQFMETVKTVILSNLSNATFNVILLANELTISGRQLNRKTKSLAGITVGAFIREVKLNAAKHMLEQGKHDTILEVSQAVGFKKSSYFSKIYTDRFGKRPIEYFNHSKK